MNKLREWWSNRKLPVVGVSKDHGSPMTGDVGKYLPNTTPPKIKPMKVLLDRPASPSIEAFRRTTKDAAGLDLTSTKRVVLPSYGTVTLVTTSCYTSIPSGCAGFLMLRSSLGAAGVMLANGVGLIDADYRGEIKVALRYFNPNPVAKYIIEAGDRIAQLVILPLQPVDIVYVTEHDQLGTTARGTGGFGSTGKR